MSYNYPEEEYSHGALSQEQRPPSDAPGYDSYTPEHSQASDDAAYHQRLLYPDPPGHHTNSNAAYQQARRDDPYLMSPDTIQGYDAYETHSLEHDSSYGFDSAHPMEPLGEMSLTFTDLLTDGINGPQAESSPPYCAPGSNTDNTPRCEAPAATHDLDVFGSYRDSNIDTTP